MEELLEKVKDNQKKILTIILGVVALIVAFIVVNPFGDSGPSEVEEVKETAVYMIESVPAHTEITHDMMIVKEIDDEDLEAIHDGGFETYKYPEDIVGAETIVDIEEGSIIKSNEMDTHRLEEMEEVKNRMGSDLSTAIPEGLRAILMPAGPAQGMVSYLNVGDKIDLLVSHTPEDGLETITPFQNIEVLLIGDGEFDYPAQAQPQDDPDSEDESRPTYPEGSSSSSAVILAMTPEQSEMLTNMKISGILQTAEITLRNNEDEEIKTLDKFGDTNFEDWRNR